jgi:hypothetical protein
MKYDYCSYNIPEEDMGVMRSLANELGLKIRKEDGPKPLYELVFSLTADKEYYYTVTFEDIEIGDGVEYYRAALKYETEKFWNELLARSTDRELLDLCNR